MARLWKTIKWALLIQIQIRHIFWILWAKGNTWEKNHFYILSSINCDIETLIWLSTKINKLHYLSFCSSNLKSEDRSIKLSIKRIDGEKPNLRFWVSHLRNPLWLFVFLRAKIRPMALEKFLKHGFSCFNLNVPFSFESQLRWHFGWLI